MSMISSAAMPGTKKPLSDDDTTPRTIKVDRAGSLRCYVKDGDSKRQHGPRHQEHPAQVYRNGVVPLGNFEFPGGTSAGHYTGVVDQNIDPAKLPLHIGDQFGNLFFGRDIAGPSCRFGI